MWGLWSCLHIPFCGGNPSADDDRSSQSRATITVSHRYVNAFNHLKNMMTQHKVSTAAILVDDLNRLQEY
jgi:hypothetical protein